MPSSCSLADAVQACLQHTPPHSHIWIALSGGLDSSVLLHLVASLPEFKSRVRAIHVHHGLSPNADYWRDVCQATCDALNIALTVHNVVIKTSGKGVEQAARQARYQAFTETLAAGDYLLTGHQADDQIETFFQRVMRGSGLQGLSAIPAQRKHQQFQILRPLLPFMRVQLQAYAEQQSLSWVEDESNQDTHFERNWWRQTLLPQLWQRYPKRKPALLRTIEQLQQDRSVLQQLLQPKLDACLRLHHWPLTAPLALNIAALMQQDKTTHTYIVRGWLERCGATLPSAIQLQSIFTEMLGAAEDCQPQWQLHDGLLQRFNGELFLCFYHPDYPPARHRLSDSETWLNITESSAITQRYALGGQIRIQPRLLQPSPEQPSPAGLLPGRYRLVAAGTLAGVKIRPSGRPGKTLKHIWQEHKVPVWLRAIWPCLLTEEGHLACMIGLTMDAQYTTSKGVLLNWVSESEHSVQG